MRALGAAQPDSKPANYVIASQRLYSIEESAARLHTLLGAAPEWDTLQHFLPERKGEVSPLERRSALASTFAATLELVKSGEMELQQDGLFGPISVRRRLTTLAS